VAGVGRYRRDSATSELVQLACTGTTQLGLLGLGDAIKAARRSAGIIVCGHLHDDLLLPLDICHDSLTSRERARMDPLSVSMAVIGLLTAAKQISSALGTLISNSKNAPKEMQSVKSTVETIRTVLLQLQTILLGRENISRKRTSLILVEQVVITLSACVTTFSELDVFVGALQSDETLGLMDRIRWATKTTTIKEHLQKLEMHKSSLTLMMTILTW
jgi:hypothetical protein